MRLYFSRLKLFHTSTQGDKQKAEHNLSMQPNKNPLKRISAMSEREHCKHLAYEVAVASKMNEGSEVDVFRLQFGWEE